MENIRPESASITCGTEHKNIMFSGKYKVPIVVTSCKSSSSNMKKTND